MSTAGNTWVREDLRTASKMFGRSQWTKRLGILTESVFNVELSIAESATSLVAMQRLCRLLYREESGG